MSGQTRVGVLSSLHPPFDTRIFQKEARTLAAAGYDVTFIVPHDRDEVVDGVRLRPFARPRGRLYRFLTSSPRMLWAAIRLGADVYHFHDAELIPAGLVLKLLGRRVVYDAHEDLPKSILDKTYLPRWIRRPLSITTHLAEKTASRAFDLVVVAGEGILRSFEAHPRTLLIRNYPIRAQFGNGTRVGRGGRDFVVVYTGGLTAGRGAVEMIEAVAEVPGSLRVRLEIYGKFWPQELETRVRGLPGFERVTYHGWVPHERISAELERADVGLVCFLPAPNHLEAGPNKLFEYMAAGLPVIASDFPAWRDIVERKDCGLCVDPAYPAAIADAIRYLAEHPERRAEMGANGRRAVLEQYNWESEGRRLLEAYETLR